MDQATVSLIVYLGNAGLYATEVGAAVMLLMPDRSGRGFGATLAALGSVAMGSELVLARLI